MHCNGIVHNDPKIRAWNTSLIVDCVFYWAVPIFLMLSGATLVKYRERYDTKTFFKKRILKVLIPLIIWSVIMLIWKISTNQINIEQISSINQIINMILNNQVEVTYGFMFEIIGIYLTMPFLSLITKEENRKVLWFTILLYFIFNATIPNILVLMGIEWNNNMTIQLGGYVIYVVLGYLLSTQDLSKKKRISLYVMAFIGLIYRYLTTFILSKQSGEVIKITWGYCSWHCILLACAVFVFIKELNLNNKLEKNEKLTKNLSKISSCSFGIYLIHFIVIYYEIKILNINVITFQWRTIGILTTYLITLAIVFILKKIPIIKYAVP